MTSAKFFFIGIFLLLTGVAVNAQQRTVLIQTKEGRVDWDKEINYQTMFGGLAEVKIISDWDVIAHRIAMINAGIGSGSLTSEQLKKFTNYRWELLNIELQLLESALTNPELIQRDNTAENTRIAQIQNEKNAVLAALKDQKNHQ